MIDKNNRPKHWEIKKLGEVCEIILGQSPSSNTYNSIRDGLPFFQGKAEFTDLYPIARKWCNAPKKIAEPNDILLSVRAPVGTTNIANQKCCIGRGLAAIRFKNYKFIFYYLKSIEHQLDEKGTGTTFRAISGDTVRTIIIPLPPISEQQQIVSKIEELFSELDKGKQQLETVRQQLKKFRQAVLKWAFEGKLSKKWRKQNLGDKTIYKILAEIRSKREDWAKSNKKRLKPITELSATELPELPENWAWIRVVETVLNTADDIVDGPFGSNLKNSDYVEGASIPVIGISNIEEGYKTKIRYITKEKFETVKRSAVHPGDIIVAKIGSTYGKTGVYPEWMPIGVIPANLLRIRPSEHYEKKLLIYFLKSTFFKKSLDKIMKSTAQPAYNVSMFKDLPIPFMCLDEQRILIDEIETRLSVCDKMEETIENCLQQTVSLRQSILKQAFEGKLV